MEINLTEFSTAILKRRDQYIKDGVDDMEDLVSYGDTARGYKTFQQVLVSTEARLNTLADVLNDLGMVYESSGIMTSTTELESTLRKAYEAAKLDYQR